MFSGSMVALVTPFKDGKIDWQSLERLLEFHINSGTHGIVPCGTTGESATLGHKEHHEIIERVIQAVNKRVPVIAGTGSNSTAEAVELTRGAEKAGADGALLISPYYNRPTQEGIYEHYKKVASAVSIPIIVYNIPGRTGKNIEPETIARIAELPAVVAVKESTGSMDQASQILSLTDLTVLSGDDSLTLPLLAIGGRGVISVVGNIIPRDVKAMLDAFEGGDLTGAQGWHRKLFPLCRDLLGLATNPIPIKAAMQILRRDTGELRLPMTPLDDNQMSSLRRTLGAYGLL